MDTFWIMAYQRYFVYIIFQKLSIIEPYICDIFDSLLYIISYIICEN